KAMSRRVMEMQSEGISDEEIRSRQRVLEQDILRTTELSLKEHFVLQKIAEVEKIDVYEDDIDDEIDRMAEQSNESPRRVRARGAAAKRFQEEHHPCSTPLAPSATSRLSRWSSATASTPGSGR